MKEQWFKKKWVRVSIHAAFWLLLFLLPYLLQPSFQGGKTTSQQKHVQSTFDLFNIIKGVFWLIVFYFNAYVLVPSLINKKRYRYYALSILAVIITLSLIEIIYFHLASNGMQFRVRPFVLFNFFPFLFILMTSTAYRMLTDVQAEEEKRKEEESEHLKSELSFLRSQINPHFMFNVLNNIVALARKNSDQVEPSLIKLSGIMRYFLYENIRDTIPLEKEIEYLESYIDLQQQRLGKNALVDLKIEGKPDGFLIEPMLLIPFVENAFKHSLMPNGSINISLKIVEQELYFTVTNPYLKSDSSIKDETSGIGLANVKRRLELSYAKLHGLIIEDDNNQYKVFLKLKLHQS